jgi:nucleotide-binding universal stress UspA family protein
MSDVIVVGVDGSETAARAAQRAAEMAAALGATLHVVTAFDDSETEVIEVGSDVWVLSSVDEASQTIDGVAAGLRLTAPAVTTSAIEGKPHAVLLAEAERLGARMIVVGNRRVQGIGRVLGSVATSVLHHAPCDVLVVKTV